MLSVLIIFKTSAYFFICHVFIDLCYAFQAISIVRFKRLYIDQLAFQGLPHLDKLHIDMCFLSSPPPLVNIQQSLSILSVTYANLSFLPDTYFSGCHKLRELVLSYNRLSTLPNLSVISDTLHTMQVEHNNLIDVWSLQDLAFPNLRRIFLGHNGINQLDIKRFILPRLHEMDVSYNSLQGLGHPKLLVPESLRESRVSLNLVENPWYCDENLSWVASASQKLDQYTDRVDLYWNPPPIDVINAQDMICHMPPSMRGKQAIHVGRDQPFLCLIFPRNHKIIFAFHIIGIEVEIVEMYP